MSGLNLPISMEALHVEFRKPGVVNQDGITGLRHQKKSPAAEDGASFTNSDMCGFQALRSGLG